MDLVRRAAAPVVVLAVLATLGGAVYTAKNIGINTSTTDMLSADLPFRRNANAIKQAFPQFRNTLVIVIDGETPDQADDAATLLAERLRERPETFRRVFYPEADAFFRENGLLYLDLDELQDLSDRLADAQPLLATLDEDMSLRGLFDVLSLAIEDAEGDEAVAVAPALDKIVRTVEAVAAGRRPELSWSELMRGEDSTAEDRRKLIVVNAVLDFGSLSPAAKAIAVVRNLANELRQDGSGGIRVRLTGSAALAHDELGSVREGMGLAAVLSLVLVVTLLTIGLRSPRLVFATLATLVMGLIWTATFATAAIGELNLISVAFAVLFIGLSVDFGIHFALRYKEEVLAGAPHAAAMARAAEGVGGALTLCAVAAAIGFLSFVPTSYRGMSELGIISGAGMFIALAANLTVLPALLTLMPLRPVAASRPMRSGDRVQPFVERHFRAILYGALALGVAAVVCLPFAWFDDDPMNLRDPEAESVSALLDLVDDPQVHPYDVTILADDLASAVEIAARLTPLPEVDEAVTLLDYVPSRQDEKLAVIEEMIFVLAPLLVASQRLPPPTAAQRRAVLVDLRAKLRGVVGPLAAEARRLAAALDRFDASGATLETLEHALLAALPKRLEALRDALAARPISLASLPADLRDRNIAADGRTKVHVYPAENLRGPEARRRFVDAAQAVAPSAAGGAVTITEAGRAVVRALLEAAGYAFVLVSLLLVALLRSLRDSLLVLAPLVLAAVLTVALTVVLSLPFNFANVIVLPLLFGLGVASGIHLVLREREIDPSVRLSETSTPRAVLFSGLTTIGSFCALALSSHRGTASMGLLLTIAITLTMLCALLVLPALMRAVSKPSPTR
ncbi:MAG: MMPL family transporter [Proteobacteria bacterium]|nr:MMPL family transporter [Pseudomonadota bacterium]